MPFASPHVCPAPGCTRVAPRGKRCPEHQQRQDTERRAGHAFYEAPPWRRLRAAHLAAFPQCVTCGAPARVVDHIATRRAAPGRSLDPSNLRSMCSPCHSRATVQTDGGFGQNATRRKT